MSKTSTIEEERRLNIAKEILARGGSTTDIAAAFGINRNSAWYWLKARNVVFADRIDSMRQAKRVSIPDGLFETLTPDTSWVLGLLVTDGCVSKQGNSRSIIIDSIDLDVCEKACSIMGIGKVVPKSSKTAAAWRWLVCSNELADRLARYGIVERKTQAIVFPELELSMNPHFVRGLWDGDGTILPTYRQIGFVSASRSFITSLREMLRSINGSMAVPCKHPTKDCWSLRYDYRKANTLLIWMYAQSSNRNRMQRKYKKAKEIMLRYA